MPFNIVLIEPEIPNNTGNIGRLSLASGCHLHLVKPLGFELSDKRLKRAGLDYWQHLSIHLYEDVDDFFHQHEGKPMVFFSSHATSEYTDIRFNKEQFLVFGKESVGLPKTIIDSNEDLIYKIPIQSPYVRSLNLANTVAIVVYEGMRQLKV